MRRAFAAILIGLLAVPALAGEDKLLVVARPWLSSDGGSNDQTNSTSRRQDRIWQKLFSLLGINYTWCDARQTKAEYCRTGVQVWNPGEAGTRTENFGGVMHIAPVIGASPLSGGYRPDSLLRTDYGDDTGPNVPQYYAFDDRRFLQSGSYQIGTATCCTTGVTVDDPEPAPEYGVALVPVGSPTRRFEQSVRGNGLLRSSTAPAGGLRPLLRLRTTNRVIRWVAPGATGTEDGLLGCQWCDSLVSDAGADTLALWEKLYSHISGAKRVVFSYHDGSGSNNADTSGVVGSHIAPSEGEVAIQLAGLSRMDSLMNHRLFDPTKLPLIRAVTVDYLCSRGARLGAHGIHPDDTTAFYATLDSLAALDPPLRIVFGVNADPDSMSTYARDLIVAARIPLARFSPSLRTGLDSTAAMNGGNWTRRRPRDTWGRFRNRIAAGDGTCEGKDSSLVCGLYAQKSLLDSVMTSLGHPGRIEPFALPPDDDWSPKNIAPFGTLTTDSVLWAIAEAGYNGVRVDRRSPETAARGASIANPRGYLAIQGYVTEGIENRTVSLLGHPGGPIMGSNSWICTFGDQAPFDTCGLGAFGHIKMIETNRAWAAFTQDVDHVDSDIFPDNYKLYIALGSGNPANYMDTQLPIYDRIYQPQRGYCLRFTANDLSGASTSAPPNGHPPRNAYWAIKSVHHAMCFINECNGRTVIRFGYPTEVRL